MDKREKETPDFMNVESFSKLPFIRPAPLKEKGIRLFGKEFGGVADSDTVLLSDDSDSVETNTLKEVKETETETGESDRKFECHYCFRKFPTSQALGGHQNAHKRERQHAKRASMARDFYPQAHAFRMNYHRFGSSSVNYSPGVTPHQYTKNINSKFYDRFYGGYGSYIQPQPPFIHGSPMAMWRIPSTHNVPTFIYDQHLARNSLPSYANIDAVQPSRNGSTTSQTEYAYQSKSLKDHISLDLHL